MAEPTLLDRLRSVEARLRSLESSTGTGLSGTDQTIKGCHDRLDALLGAGNAAPDGTLVTDLNADLLDGLHAAESGVDAHVVATDASGNAQIDGILTLLSQMFFSGANSGVVLAHIPRKQTTAGSATPVFSITTIDETGDNDAGSYGCIVITEAAHSATPSSTNVASMLNMAAFTRSQKDTGAGTTSYEFEVFQTSSAATDAAVRDVTGIALTATESSEYVVNVELNVGRSGSSQVNTFVNCFVLLIWQTYTTAPVITAL